MFCFSGPATPMVQQDLRKSIESCSALSDEEHAIQARAQDLKAVRVFKEGKNSDGCSDLRNSEVWSRRAGGHVLLEAPLGHL